MLLRNLGATHDEKTSKSRRQQTKEQALETDIKTCLRLWTELRAFVAVGTTIFVPESCSVEIVNNFTYEFGAIIAFNNIKVFKITQLC
jgi:hypothetical protein